MTHHTFWLMILVIKIEKGNVYNSITGFGSPEANLHILQIIQKTDLKIVYCLYVG